MDALWQPRIEKTCTVLSLIRLDLVYAGASCMDSRLTEAASYFLMVKADAKLQARTRDLFLKSLQSLRRQKGGWANRGDGPFFCAVLYIEGVVGF